MNEKYMQTNEFEQLNRAFQGDITAVLSTEVNELENGKLVGAGVCFFKRQALGLRVFAADGCNYLIELRDFIEQVIYHKSLIEQTVDSVLSNWFVGGVIEGTRPPKHSVRGINSFKVSKLEHVLQLALGKDTSLVITEQGNTCLVTMTAEQRDVYTHEDIRSARELVEHAVWFLIGFSNQDKLQGIDAGYFEGLKNMLYDVCCSNETLVILEVTDTEDGVGVKLNTIEAFFKK